MPSPQPNGPPRPQPDRRDLYERKLNADEVAPMLGVSKMTVYRLVDSGELFGYKVGRSVKIPESAVRDFLYSAVAEPREERMKRLGGENLRPRY